MQANPSKNWEKPLAQALGGLDEALFALSTYTLGMRQKTPYLSDKVELSGLEQIVGQAIEPVEFFARPPQPAVEVKPASLPTLAYSPDKRIQGYTITKLEWPSAVSTGYPVNDRVHAFYLENPSHPSAPALLYLHGWLMFEPGLTLRMPLGWAAALGFNLLVLHLPFHFERTPAGTTSGELAITANLPLAIRGLQQAVSDVRQCLAWLKEQQPQRPVFLLGKSLGGLIGAATLTAESDFVAASLIVPAVGTHSAIWQSSYTRLIRRDLRQQGLDEMGTARLLQIIQPGRYQPRLNSDRILVIKAGNDRVCFPAEIDDFSSRWHTHLYTVPTGHLTATFDPRARRATLDHFRRFSQA